MTVILKISTPELQLYTLKSFVWSRWMRFACFSFRKLVNQVKVLRVPLKNFAWWASLKTTYYLYIRYIYMYRNWPVIIAEIDMLLLLKLTCYCCWNWPVIIAGIDLLLLLKLTCYYCWNWPVIIAEIDLLLLLKRHW